MDKSRLIEMGLEGFAKNPLYKYYLFLQWAGLQKVEELTIEVKSSRVNYWKDSMTPVQIGRKNDILYDVIKQSRL